LFNLFSELVGNSGIPIENYKQIFSVNRWQLDIPENYEQNRVLININNNDLLFNKESFSNLHTSEEKTLYLVSNFDEYLKNSNVYELDVKDLEFLLKLEDINNKQIAIVMNNINKASFPLDTMQVALLMRFIDIKQLHDRLEPATIRVLLKIVSKESSLNLLMKTIKKFSLLEVEELLIDIIPSYKHLFAGTNRTCVLQKHETTEDLLDYLTTHQIVSTWSYKNDNFHINLKRNRK
jgi:hypothetical protein